MRRPECFGSGVVDCFALKYDPAGERCMACKWRPGCQSGVVPCANCAVYACEENHGTERKITID